MTGIKENEPASALAATHRSPLALAHAACLRGCMSLCASAKNCAAPSLLRLTRSAERIRKPPSQNTEGELTEEAIDVARVRERLAATGLTMTATAQASGMSLPTLVKFLRGGDIKLSNYAALLRLCEQEERRVHVLRALRLEAQPQ